jgi:hypothetical protein
MLCTVIAESYLVEPVRLANTHFSPSRVDRAALEPREAQLLWLQTHRYVSLGQPVRLCATTNALFCTFRAAPVDREPLVVGEAVGQREQVERYVNLGQPVVLARVY